MKIIGNQLDLGPMEEFRAEMEKKVAKILQLIQNKDKIPKDTKKELLGLVKDLQEQYLLLCSHCDRLKEESERTFRVRDRLNSSSSHSSSDSDSEYYSSEEIDRNNSKLKNESHDMAKSDKEELVTANLEVAELKLKLESMTEEKEALNLEYLTALSKLREAEMINKHPGNEANEKEGEFSSLKKLSEFLGNRASTWLKELDQQLNALKTDLQTQYDEKRGIKERIESKTIESEHESEGLKSLISELHLSPLMEKVRENENNSLSRIQDLKNLVSNLQFELESLQAQNGQPEGNILGNEDGEVDQFKGLMDQVNNMQHELTSLHSQKLETELLLEVRNKEISQNLIEVKTLTEELGKKTLAEQIMMEQKEGLLAKVKDLEMEVVFLHEQKKELENQIKSKIFDSNQFQEEKEGLDGISTELEGSFTKREEEIDSLKRIFEVKENEASVQIVDLKVQIERMQQELDTLKAQKCQLELLIEGEKQKYLQSLTQIEDENMKLTCKIGDQQRVLKEQEDIIKKSIEEQKILKRWSFGFKESKLNTHLLERKMEELAEDFRMKMEDHIRILYRRIHVAEQIHIENRNKYRRTKELSEQEGLRLEVVVAKYEAQFRKIKDLLYPAYDVFPGLDSITRKLEENENFVHRICKISNDLQLAKVWVAEKNNEVEKLKQNVNCLVRQVDNKEEEKILLQEKVWELESEVSKEGGETWKLREAVKQLEEKVEELEERIKEKNERLLGLGEEKREAIRQLCILIDYHRNRCDHLKSSISKMTVRLRKVS